MRRHVTDAVWIIGGTVMTALGTLIGIRLLTQFLAPDAFGTVSLALGLSTLTIALVAAPLTQAAIHYHPALDPSLATHELLSSLTRCFRVALPWVAAAATASAVAYIGWGGGSPLLTAVLAVLLALDCWRSARLSLLNAARQHRRYALWVASDAWLRPLTGALALVMFGRSATSLLGAYALVSMGLLIAFSGRPRASQSAGSGQYSPQERRALDNRMWSYAVPLIPLGVIAWVSNLGDRYMIGGILGVYDAGVYAAVYGLSSSPFLMVGGTVELGLRPIHQAAVACGDHSRARKIFRLWLAAVASVCAVGVLVFAFAHQFIASLFVGKAYRYASGMMPWIAFGYAIRSVSYVFERMCYAYGRTHLVLIIQSCGVIATIIATPLLVLKWGLRGAAFAVPLYFSAQLAIAMVLAHFALKQRDIRGRASYETDAIASTTS